MFTLLAGDCYQHVEAWKLADALITDPPYGIGYKCNARAARSGIPGLKAAATAARDMIEGDDQPFDPAPWLGFSRVALFGANHFASRLPDRGKWIVWDKREGGKRDSHSDGELIWTNQQGALRIHRQLWRGVCRAGEENCSRSKKLHPNQKPVALIDYIFDELGVRPGMVIADPFMGSGSTGIVALRRGCRFIGSESDPRHFETARRRLEAESFRLLAA